MFAVKEMLHFVTSNLKHVASLIKFSAECGSLGYRASLHKVTMTMAIPVKITIFNFLLFQLHGFCRG